jgi:hypothetical protein
VAVSAYGIWETARVPESLLLKVRKSVAVRLPVLNMEELGILTVKVPAESVEVNKEPVVLVATVIACCLELKVPQSVEESWPESEAEAVGRLMTKALVVVVMLKMLPAVPVETFPTTEPLKAIVVEVPIIESLPSPAEKLRPLPRLRLPKVVVPRPPEETASGLVKVKEVKLGVAETAMVLVPLRAMLLPALKKEIGELYRLLHWVVEAESGIT